ncbi:MAG: diacylglycerol kinase family lipid kinase [Chloroflexi bacterium]|nr:diacylglycerol kinase family lipid kinase [Chloroflexota bacterium]MCI0730257.1 diacylglycerol kinase family lipid kinase [Chloroflexota bacterium]
MKELPEATLIYNPLAGPANWNAAIRKVADFWRKRGWRVHVRPTAYAGHAPELAREAAGAGHCLVLAAGGDGTLGEVAGGLVGSRTILAPLPTGTGNSFAKELQMPRPGPLHPDGLLRAAESLANGRVYQVDVGLCDQGQPWLLWASTGVDSYLVKHIEPRSKVAKRFGPLGYVGESLPVIPQFPGMKATVTVDGQSLIGDFLMVTISNCRRFAGGELLLSPEARLDDGLFEVWLFRGRDMRHVFPYLMQVALGLHLQNPDIVLLTGREITVQTDPPMPFHQDGDPAGTTPFTCRLQPGALRLLAPDTAPADLFVSAGEPLPAP